MGPARRAQGSTRALERERGFTLVELTLGIVLVGIIAYASLSLMSTSFGATGRMFAEFESRKRVLMLLREMAEGTVRYAGYLGGSDIKFGPGEGELEGTCVFDIVYPDLANEGQVRSVRYVWRPDLEVIEQQVDDGELRRLLTGVASFSVTKVAGDLHTIRVEIGHRVKGFANPIVRAAEGQARNMNVWSVDWAQKIVVCEP